MKAFILALVLADALGFYGRAVACEFCRVGGAKAATSPTPAPAAKATGGSAPILNAPAPQSALSKDFFGPTSTGTENEKGGSTRSGRRGDDDYDPNFETEGVYAP